MGIRVTVNVECPKVPNYLRLKSDVAIDIKEFTDDQLREIGQQWTMQLIKAAHERQKASEVKDA